MNLTEYSKKLYRLSAKMNLYISFAGQKGKLDVDRLKKEIYQIRQIVTELEKIIDCFFDEKKIF